MPRRRHNPPDRPSTRMHAVYSPINAAWILLYGDSLIDLDGQRFWPKKADLVWDLNIKGLKLAKGNRVVKANPGARMSRRRNALEPIEPGTFKLRGAAGIRRNTRAQPPYWDGKRWTDRKPSGARDVLFEYGAEPNARKGNGFIDAVWENGRRITDTWVPTGLAEWDAEDKARRTAKRAAMKFVGEWNIELRRRGKASPRPSRGESKRRRHNPSGPGYEYSTSALTSIANKIAGGARADANGLPNQVYQYARELASVKAAAKRKGFTAKQIAGAVKLGRKWAKEAGHSLHFFDMACKDVG